MKLVLVFCWMGVAFAAAPFSHRQHLQIGLACIGCHAGASRSTKATDDLLPPKQVCRGCHDDSITPQRPAALAVPVAKFNHALHLRMGNLAPLLARAIDKGIYLQPSAGVRPHLNSKNACEACHRGMEESDQVTAAALPKMADCLVCHGKIEPPWSCDDCHVKSPAMEPPSHSTPHFIDLHSRGTMNLDKSTCAVCHGREFRCAGCH